MRDETVERSLLNIPGCRWYVCGAVGRDSIVEISDFLNGLENGIIGISKIGTRKMGKWKMIGGDGGETFLGTKTMGQWINEASEKASLPGVQNGGYLTG